MVDWQRVKRYRSCFNSISIKIFFLLSISWTFRKSELNNSFELFCFLNWPIRFFCLIRILIFHLFPPKWLIIVPYYLIHNARSFRVFIWQKYFLMVFFSSVNYNFSPWMVSSSHQFWSVEALQWLCASIPKISNGNKLNNTKWNDLELNFFQ